MPTTRRVVLGGVGGVGRGASGRWRDRDVAGGGAGAEQEHGGAKAEEGTAAHWDDRLGRRPRFRDGGTADVDGRERAATVDRSSVALRGERRPWNGAPGCAACDRPRPPGWPRRSAATRVAPALGGVVLAGRCGLRPSRRPGPRGRLPGLPVPPGDRAVVPRVRHDQGVPPPAQRRRGGRVQRQRSSSRWSWSSAACLGATWAWPSLTGRRLTVLTGCRPRCGPLWSPWRWCTASCGTCPCAPFDLTRPLSARPAIRRRFAGRRVGTRAIRPPAECPPSHAAWPCPAADAPDARPARPGRALHG